MEISESIFDLAEKEREEQRERKNDRESGGGKKIPTNVELTFEEPLLPMSPPSFPYLTDPEKKKKKRRKVFASTKKSTFSVRKGEEGGK